MAGASWEFGISFILIWWHLVSSSAGTAGGTGDPELVLEIQVCLFFPFSQLQQEKAEWESLNKLLMRHGLKPVSLASCRNIPGKEMLILQVFVFENSKPKFLRHL